MTQTKRAAARQAPAGLTVGYAYGNALTSRIIEWREAGGPSHATTMVAPGYVIDARYRGGVARRPVSYLSGTRVRWFRVPATEARVREAIAFLTSQCGQAYAWLDILAFAVPSSFKRLTGAKHPWMCSYLQAGCEVAATILPKPPVGLERLDPNDLMLMNSAHYAVELPGPSFD